MATWNQNIGITNWQNRTNQGGKLSLSPNVSSGSYNLSLQGGNSVLLPTEYQSFTVSTLQFIDTGTPGSLDQLYAYGGQLFFNGERVISTISTSVLDWSLYPAISDVAIQNYNIRDVGFLSSATINTDDLFFISSLGRKLVVSTLNGNTAFFSSLSNNDRIFTNRLWTNSISSGSISTGTLRANNITTRNLSTLNISSGSIISDTANITTQLNVKDIELDTFTYPLYDSNTTYNPGNRVSYTTGAYQAVLTNLNVTPGENIPLWYPNSSYFVNNFTFVVGIGSFKCLSNISGSTTSPNSDESNWIDFSASSAGSQLWTNINSDPPVKCGIVGDVNSYISVGTIVASNANISSLSGNYANNVSSQLSVLSNFSTTFNPTAYSNWSLYPARSNVNFAGYNANSINTVNTNNTNTNALTVGGGGQGWNGNAQFNQMASFPYWYNFVMDANITTTNANTIYCPTNNQYFSDWFVATNKLDPLTILPTAITTTKLHAYSAGNVIPTGYIDLRSHNYRVTTLIPVATLDYRGQLYLGTEGYGANAYIGINIDGFEAVQNVGTSIILNADSVAGSLLAGFSRITSQAGRNQMLATVQTQIYAGYLGADPAITYYAGFEQSLLNAEGGGATQTMRSRGADVLGFPGSRTDITSECPSNTSVPSQMNIYSSQNGNLYTDGDFYIGYGGSDPRYGYNSDQQKIHIINTNDIQGVTTTGVAITNVNSVQGINSNSFIKNIHYLVGYDTDVVFDINFLEVPREVRSTIDFKYSTIEFYSNVFIPAANQYFTVSTLSSILFAQSSYTSSFMLNQTDVSTFKTNINSFNVNQFNEVLGISTILSSFIINVDRASIKQIDKVSTIRADNGFFSNITNSNIINTNILTATTGNFVNLSTGTITPTNVSTLNISTGTIRANEGFFSTLYGNTGNFNNISTNQLVARNGVFDGISTMNISTNQIVARNGLFDGISTINISTNQVVARNGLFNDLTASSISTINISTNSITSDSLSTNTILTSNISTNTLNMITGTGNVLSLKSYGSQDPILAIERTIDGVETPEGGFGSVDGQGLILVGFSTLTIQASDDLKLESGQNIRLSPQENVIVSASNFIVNRNANISSINTNFISTFNINATYVDLYSQDSNLDPAIIFSRNIDGEKFNDGSITTNNVGGFLIGAVSTMSIISADDMIIRSIQGNIGIVSDSSNIVIGAPSSITLSASETFIPYNLNVSTISTGIIYADTLIAYNGIGTANLTTSNLNTVYASTGSVYANDVNTTTMNVSSIIFNNVINQYVNNIDGVSYMNIEAPLKTYNFNYISNTGGNNPGVVLQFDTTRTGSLTFNANDRFDMNKPLNVNQISTGSLFVNNSVENSISSLRISSGSLFSGIISSIHTQSSTIRATQTITASTIAVDRIRGAASDTNIFTQNLFPLGAGSQLGYGPTLGGGGYYNYMFARSTFTTNINPVTDGVTTSNNIKVTGNLSTQNVFVSTINRKLYPYTSTFGILNSASTFTFSGTTATTPQIMYSNITFPHIGTYIVQGKNTISKSSGGSGQEPYGYFSLSRGLYPSTFNIQDGFNSIPYLNHQNISTFNTFTSEIYVSSMNTNTRFITYADQSGHNYTINFGLGNLRATYIPSQGLNPE